jgi:Fe-S oxidoreductase
LPNEKIEITVSGIPLQVDPGITLVHAIWSAGRSEEILTGCDGGVCGACTVSIQRKEEPGKTIIDLACCRLVEEGMMVFPYPVAPVAPVAPCSEPSAEILRKAYPTLDRCTKCDACTTVCPMGIPVMESIKRMQAGALEEVAEDYTTCIHCGQCRAICEDRVQPHTMGMWVRRSLAMQRSADTTVPVDLDASMAEQEWAYLLSGDREGQLQHCQQFRQTGKVGL